MNKIKNESQMILGKNPIIEAIESEHSIHKIYIAEGLNKSVTQKLLDLAKQKGIVIQFVPKKKLDQMAEGNQHQGMIASIAAYDYIDLNDLLKKSKENKFPFLVMLDEIEDPHNLGSILRTADVVGVDGIIIPKRRSVGLTATVAKTSTGAVEYIPVARVTNLAQTIDQLKKEGYWVIGTDASAEKIYTEVDFQIPVCLVIGSEGKGISRLIREKCDLMIKMPMKGHINSLNASVAAALVMYEVYRQRGFQ